MIRGDPSGLDGVPVAPFPSEESLDPIVRAAHRAVRPIVRFVEPEEAVSSTPGGLHDGAARRAENRRPVEGPSSVDPGCPSVHICVDRGCRGRVVAGAALDGDEEIAVPVARQVGSSHRSGLEGERRPTKQRGRQPVPRPAPAPDRQAVAIARGVHVSEATPGIATRPADDDLGDGRSRRHVPNVSEPSTRRQERVRE